MINHIQPVRQLREGLGNNLIYLIGQIRNEALEYLGIILHIVDLTQTLQELPKLLPTQTLRRFHINYLPSLL